MGQDQIWGATNNSGQVGGPATTTDIGSGKRGLDVATQAPAMATIIDEPSATVTYIGVAPIGSAGSGAVWQIKKMTVSGTVTSITWADGNNSFDNIWDNRAALSYS